MPGQGQSNRRLFDESLCSGGVCNRCSLSLCSVKSASNTVLHSYPGRDFNFSKTSVWRTQCVFLVQRLTSGAASLLSEDCYHPREAIRINQTPASTVNGRKWTCYIVSRFSIVHVLEGDESLLAPYYYQLTSGDSRILRCWI